jgi:hypothetical protein
MLGRRASIVVVLDLPPIEGPPNPTKPAVSMRNITEEGVLHIYGRH